ncbi:MAG: hypothetical protein HY231_00010 [Acidobacteria bacterium]|nr:hypothetical protein [Acidobacteriota bacterium]
MFNSQNKRSKEPMVHIVGEKLSAVTFVQDYVQLHFDGPTLTLLNWPVVEVGESHVQFGMEGYRDKLCEQIGKQVLTASVAEEQEVRIEFTDRSFLFIALEPDDCRTAETVIFNNGNGGIWVL